MSRRLWPWRSSSGARRPSPPSAKATAAPAAPPPPSGSAPTITIAPTGTLEPDQVYANVDVTVTCAVGSTFTNGWIYILQKIGAAPGRSRRPARERRRSPARGWSTGIGSRSATGPPRAFVRVTKNGQQTQVEASRTITLVPGVIVRIADQGQLTGTSGGGVKLARRGRLPDAARPASRRPSP